MAETTASTLHVDVDRIRAHIDTLAGFTTTPGAGSTRLSYTPEYRGACDYLLDYVRALGLEGRLDAIGNLRVVMQGTNTEAPRVVTGSHLDTVIHGGNFDGILGVVAGIEVLHTLVAAGLRPNHPIEVVSFVEEEGTTFRCPLAGSKALTGVLSAADLFSLQDENGRSMHDAATAFGLAPERLACDRFTAGGVKSMIELHIEQGAVLESLDVPVGIVSHIAGSDNHRVRLIGRANHAGTTPMHLRCDALACAAECVSAIERYAADPVRKDTVATVGRILCKPNAVNVIPGRVEFSIDVRDIDQSRIKAASNELLDSVTATALRRGIDYDTELTASSPPRPMSRRLVTLLERLAGCCDIPCNVMVSGALHDAAMMTRVAEVGMIFVPSREGRSHSPGEWTDYDDIEAGANLLLAAIVSETGVAGSTRRRAIR
jgi:allantoate deiminase